MNTAKRALATLATTALLTAGAAALAAPAHADIHAQVAGLIGADTNGTIDVSLGSSTILVIPNILSPLI
ncbi:hypothetical protein [Streptomyces sp. NBC_00648]|uniref:hypothetical protein n=1 Tax=Streptomyces sp. NBC_00648 TaxID=2975797 RepID=UPI002F90674C